MLVAIQACKVCCRSEVTRRPDKCSLGGRGIAPGDTKQKLGLIRRRTSNWRRGKAAEGDICRARRYLDIASKQYFGIRRSPIIALEQLPSSSSLVPPVDSAANPRSRKFSPELNRHGVGRVRRDLHIPHQEEVRRII